MPIPKKVVSRLLRPSVTQFAIITALLSVFAFGAAKLLKPGDKSVPMTATDRWNGVVQIPQQRGREKTTQAISLAITRWGFAPEEVIAKSDKLAIFINNQTSENDFKVALTKPHPTKTDEEIKLGEWNLRSGYKKSADIQLNLPEGRYTLKVLNMPDRKCTIVIPKNDQ